MVKIGWFGGPLNHDSLSEATGALVGSGVGGLANITAGNVVVHVTFPSLVPTPLIFVTPFGDAGTWWLANQSDAGFDVVLSGVKTHDVTFSWSAEPTPAGAVMWHSDYTSSPVTPPAPSTETTEDEPPLDEEVEETPPPEDPAPVTPPPEDPVLPESSSPDASSPESEEGLDDAVPPEPEEPAPAEPPPVEEPASVPDPAPEPSPSP
jgi:hypothetical protein